MNSNEIKESGKRPESRWLQEIAYQLAVMNEREAKRDEEIVDLGEFGKVKFPKVDPR